MKRFATCALLLALLLAGCGAPADPDTAQESIQVIAMDTPMLITTYGKRSVAAAYAAEDCIRDLEAALSRTDPDSEVSRLNRAGGEPVEVGEDLHFLLRDAKYLSNDTAGAFDITIAPVASAWGFTEDQFRVPSQAELDALLKLVDYEQIHFSAPPPLSNSPSEPLTASLGPGQAIDLGGIAKGYAADQMKAYLNENGVHEGFINLGGNVLTLGEKKEGPYRIGIQTPFDENGAVITTVEIQDQSVVTSGRYERYFEKDGHIYHHILNPADGYPYESGLNGVTIISDSSMEGDALSTICFALGMEKSRELLSSMPEIDAVFIDEDNRLHFLNEP